MGRTSSVECVFLGPGFPPGFSTTKESSNDGLNNSGAKAAQVNKEYRAQAYRNRSSEAALKELNIKRDKALGR